MMKSKIEILCQGKLPPDLTGDDLDFFDMFLTKYSELNDISEKYFGFNFGIVPVECCKPSSKDNINNFENTKHFVKNVDNNLKNFTNKFTVKNEILDCAEKLHEQTVKDVVKSMFECDENLSYDDRLDKEIISIVNEFVNSKTSFSIYDITKAVRKREEFEGVSNNTVKSRFTYFSKSGDINYDNYVVEIKQNSDGRNYRLYMPFVEKLRVFHALSGCPVKTLEFDEPVVVQLFFTPKDGHVVGADDDLIFTENITSVDGCVQIFKLGCLVEPDEHKYLILHNNPDFVLGEIVVKSDGGKTYVFADFCWLIFLGKG